MDSVDSSPLPLRPIDEPGMEEADTAGIGEYDYYGGSVVVVEKIVYFTQRPQRSGERSAAKPWRSLREIKR